MSFKRPARHLSMIPKSIAADPKFDAKPGKATPMSIRAQQVNQRLNKRLWLERVGDPAAPSMSELQHEALSNCRWRPSSQHLTKAELWAEVRREAAEQAIQEPVLASFFHMTVIMHDSFEKSLAFLLANKLASSTLLGTQLTRIFLDAYKDDPELLDACVADLQAVYDRDPACETYVQCLVFFKGFQAIQVQRIAHWLFHSGRQALALALQSRMSEVFTVDIHPGAQIGRGVLMDHASGIVIGETAIVGDNVSMLHHVTLGGSGTGAGTRHPTIGNGVLLGAGVSVLGPVVIGHCTKIGAGSVVVTNMPENSVAVGVPARVVKKLDPGEQPTKDMDQIGGFILDYMI